MFVRQGTEVSLFAAGDLEEAPEMYVVPPPKRPDPLSGSEDLRIYQTWKGSNVRAYPVYSHLLSHLKLNIMFVTLTFTNDYFIRTN